MDIEVLEEDYSSEWSSISPSFAIPKKNRTIRVVTDFRKNRTQLIVETSPISYSKDWNAEVIRSMRGFSLASALDLNMGYYHFELDADVQKLCTIVFPWRKYKYKRLPMSIKIATMLMFFKTSCLSLSKIWNMLRLT
jgi:hypothetical protein